MPSTPAPSAPSTGPAADPLRRLAAVAPAGLPLARGAVRRVLASLFGREGPPFDPERHAGDPGLLGPGSASWRLLAEPAAIAGGLRALLTQLLHPLAMAGVADHSAYREDPLGRLSRTSAYVTVSSLGATPEALAVTQRVRTVHERVVGIAPDGLPYRADDPHLLVWVSIALTSSFLRADERWAPSPLDADDRDRFVLEQSRLAALLDPRVDLRPFLRDPAARRDLRDWAVELPLLDGGGLPRSLAELDEALASFGPELAVGAQGEDAMHFLRRPPLPRGARLGYRSFLLGALGSMPPEHRRLLGLLESDRAADLAMRQAGALLTTMRLATGPSPALDAARRRAVGRSRGSVAGGGAERA